MDIKQISFSNHKKKSLSFTIYETYNRTKPELPPSQTEVTKADMTSQTCTQDDVIEPQVIRIPTGENLRSESKQDCDHSETIPLILTPAVDQDEPLQDNVTHYSDTDDVESEAIVRVRRPSTCEYKSEVSASVVTPVAELMTEGLDITEAQVEAVPLDQHFYNQWARLPREEDPDADDAPCTRRPTSVRMLPATGSLKSYTLMNAIVRDKQSPIENYATLCHNFKTGMPSGSSLAIASDCNNNNNSSSSRSSSGSSRTSRRGQGQGQSQPARQGSTRSMRRCTGLQTLSPVTVDVNAKTALGPFQRYPAQDRTTQTLLSPYIHDRSYSACLRSKRCSEQNKRDGFHPSSGARYPKSAASRSSSAPTRLQQSLPLNIASFFFSDEMDARNVHPRPHKLSNQPHQHLHPIAKKQPRLTSKNQQRKDSNQEAVDKGDKNGAIKGKNRKDVADTNSCNSSNTQCVQFIDVAEVKKLLMKKTNVGMGDELPEQTIEARAVSRAATAMSRRAVSSAAQRHYGNRMLGEKAQGADEKVLSGSLALSVSAFKTPDL